MPTRIIYCPHCGSVIPIRPFWFMSNRCRVCRTRHGFATKLSRHSLMTIVTFFVAFGATIVAAFVIAAVFESAYAFITGDAVGARQLAVLVLFLSFASVLGAASVIRPSLFGCHVREEMSEEELREKRFYAWMLGLMKSGLFVGGFVFGLLPAPRTVIVGITIWLTWFALIYRPLTNRSILLESDSWPPDLGADPPASTNGTDVLPSANRGG